VRKFNVTKYQPQASEL